MLFGLQVPLIVAPMAGGPSSPELVIAACEAGALGSIGAAYSTAKQIDEFARQVTSGTARPFAINLFVPQPERTPADSDLAKAAQAMEPYRRALHLTTPTLKPPFAENFSEQFAAVLKIKPAVLSFIFGCLESDYVKAAKKRGIFLLGTATSLEEARALEASEVDAVVLQGVGAGGHRGIFDAEAKDPEISTIELLKACREKIEIPLVAAGGIMNAQDIREAVANGARAVQMGTAFLTCTEAGTSAPYRRALLASSPRSTRTTRVFSGRLARGLENRFMREMERRANTVLPFPAQNKFTRDLRAASAKTGSSDFLSLWCGSGKGDLWTGSAAELIQQLFR